MPPQGLDPRMGYALGDEVEQVTETVDMPQEMQMADLDDIPDWYLVPFDKLLEDFRLDNNGNDPTNINELDKWYRNKRTTVAQGGRIGYNRGRVVNPGGYSGETDYENWLIDNYDLLVTDLSWEDHAKYSKQFRDQKAQGGRIGAQEGGLMNLGGMEKDYRQEGGFVPLGGEERADDVPARLSKNEFVFTADAVRAAGGGDIDAGAEIMENVMENLEQGGQVSEDSQGLEGARDMFATAQRLEGVL